MQVGLLPVEPDAIHRVHNPRDKRIILVFIRHQCGHILTIDEYKNQGRVQAAEVVDSYHAPTRAGHML
jgi:hypothetical protein